ncbi:hypothetical protein Pla123a_31680 [Posidoniimonas polymericola]|uniref:Ice-binding protein C-terminal domain-containing protein n=1 Tax=Posidoniimonas polymericola TaxID=2528002 RepID=A0A5C5YLM9_9BACT|nr:LamG-like jellyroll fold domain-containing protein [Posidoniimonas polymericola]TWT75658.1 hypothetical protein Pla123a_31680 [Posidoniimonas polymericola]
MFAFARCRTSLVGPALSTLLAFAGVASESQAVITHQYLFNSGDGLTIVDSVGTANGSALDGATVNVADSRLVLDGVSGYGALPGPDIAVNTYSAISLESWFVQNGNTNQFTFLAGFGRTSEGLNGESANLGYDYLMLQPTRGPGDQGSRGAISFGTFDGEVGVTDGARDLNDGQLHHVVMTVDATDLAYYVDGIQIGTAPLSDVPDASLANVSTDLAYLGRALYPDPFFEGSIFEFTVHDNALSATDVETRFQSGCIAGCGEPLQFVVDRDTGVGTFTNELAIQNIVAYSISSAAGAIDTANWASVADNGDADSGGSIDADDVWQLGATINSTEISETDPIGGGGPDDGFGVGADVSLGALWTKSPFEDLTVSVTTFDGISEATFELPVTFTGNGGAGFSRSDLDVDGDIDADDYATLMANHLQTLAGTTAVETFPFGDIDGDLDNDFSDFRLFKNDFIAANGAAAFAALGAVPEPSTALLVGLSAFGLTACRRRS